MERKIDMYENLFATNDITRTAIFKRAKVRKAILNEINSYSLLQSHWDKETLPVKVYSELTSRTRERRRALLNRYRNTLPFYIGGSRYGV